MRDEDDKLTFFYGGNQDHDIFKLLRNCIKEQEHNLVDYYDEFLIDVYLLLDEPKTKYIAIDWDNTLSADRDFFLYFIQILQKAGFIPFVCTLRAPDKENIDEIKSVLEEAEIAIYLTNGKPKRKFMKKLGIKVHLWIDDFYPGICRDSAQLLAKNNIDG
ncbi:MAG: hypothetical protein V3U71_00055 [Cocleimonas sp.]